MALICKTDYSANVSSIWKLFVVTYRASSTGALVKSLTMQFLDTLMTCDIRWHSSVPEVQLL